MAYDPFEIRTLADVVMEIKPPQTFFRDRFFNNMRGEKLMSTSTVEFHIETGVRKVARFTDCNGEHQEVQRNDWTIKSVIAPYIKHKIPCSCQDLIKRGIGGPLFPTDQEARNTIQSLLVSDMMELQDMIIRTEEIMCRDALETGKVIIKGENIDAEIDYELPASHVVLLAGGDLWSDAASLPFDKLRELVRLLKQDIRTSLRNVCRGDEQQRNKLYFSRQKLSTGNSNTIYRQPGH